MGTVWEPRRMGTFTIGSPYQRTGEDTPDLEDLRACHSELQTV